MNKSIFLSYPKPFNKQQEDFIQTISVYLESRGIVPRTLGVTDYDMNAPLTAIRRLMHESNGLITIAFRRTLIKNGEGKPGTPHAFKLKDKWITSPYSHIEPAMAFQIGLPVLVLREEGVISDGILEKGVLGTYMPEFDLSKPGTEYFASNEWKQMITQWEGYVSRVVETKGKPPQLY